MLNQSIILKHRLRPHELDMFDDHRTVATKIILPIDRGDLRAGGQYMFVGQRGEDAVLANFLHDRTPEAARDRKTLDVLDDLPSFDPFLVREQLRREGLTPAPCYFAISDADTRRMLTFVQAEIDPLTSLTLGGGQQLWASANTMAVKLMSNETATEMEPLRQAMRLTHREFADGLFAWRGLLYYKWGLSELRAQLPEVMAEIRTLKPTGGVPPELTANLANTRRRIVHAINDSMESVQQIVDVYDRAFVSLTARGRPLEFRDFLIEAPQLFLELGEWLGVLHHVVSFWRFRFKKRQPTPVSALDLVDILADFDQSLVSREDGEDPSAVSWPMPSLVGKPAVSAGGRYARRA